MDNCTTIWGDLICFDCMWMNNHPNMKLITTILSFQYFSFFFSSFKWYLLYWFSNNSACHSFFCSLLKYSHEVSPIPSRVSIMLASSDTWWKNGGDGCCFSSDLSFMNAVCNLKGVLHFCRRSCQKMSVLSNRPLKICGSRSVLLFSCVEVYFQYFLASNKGVNIIWFGNIVE